TLAFRASSESAPATLETLQSLHRRGDLCPRTFPDAEAAWLACEPPHCAAPRSFALCVGAVGSRLPHPPRIAIAAGSCSPLEGDCRPSRADKTSAGLFVSPAFSCP